MNRLILKGDYLNTEQADLDCVSSTLLGKVSDFEPLVQRYQVELKGFCYRFLLDRSLAEDAAQDIFVKAFQSLKQYRASSSFRTWLYKIARNHCIDLLRSRYRKREEFNVPLDNKGAQSDLSKQTIASTLEAKDELMKALSLLSSEHREIIVLKESQDLSYQELAEILECSIDAIKSKLRRANAELIGAIRQLEAEC